MIQTLKIGTVADRCGITVDAVRFYERRGVLPKPARRASGYREYSEATIERIRFVKALQALGFTLDEVVEVLSDVDTGVASCEQSRPRFATVLARIDAKIAGLGAIRRELVATVKRCSAGRCTFVEQATCRTSGGAALRMRRQNSRAPSPGTKQA